MSNQPPPRPPKPGQVKVVRALYKYTAQYPDELSFDEGDVLYILDAVSDPNWWKAKCGNKVGLVPCNYVGENVEILETPLHDAAKRGNEDFLNECISNGVSVNSLDKAGNTPLYWAAHGGHISCMMPLLNSKNIEINIQNKLGDTPAHAAAWKGHKEALSLLLSYGIDMTVVNQDGKIPLDLARDPEIIDLINKYLAVDVDNSATEYLGDSEELDSD